MSELNIIYTLICCCAVLQIWLHVREIQYQQLQAQIYLHDGTHEYVISKTWFAIVDISLNALFTIFMLSMLFNNYVALVRSIWGFDSGYQWMVLVSVVMFQSAFQRIVTMGRLWMVDRRYGHSNISLRTFSIDTLIQAGLLLCVAGTLGLGAIYILRAGWIAGWPWLVLLWSGFMLVRSWIYPVLIAPIFNDYRSIEDGQFRNQINTLAQQAGMVIDEMVVMDGSRRSSHGNAQVTGLGAFRRVVLLDTLDEILSRDEMLAVIAHEFGHLHLHHMSVFRLYNFLLATILIGLFAVTAEFLGVNVGAGLAMLWLLIPSFTFIVKPITSALVRRFEYEADAFAKSCDYGTLLAGALRKLILSNGSPHTSEPLYSLVYQHHPTPKDRLVRLEPEVGIDLQVSIV